MNRRKSWTGKLEIVFFHLVAEARREGRSVLLATQSLHDVERICDRAAILHEGRQVAVERAVRLRSRSLRRVEMRFAGPVSAGFICLPAQYRKFTPGR